MKRYLQNEVAGDETGAYLDVGDWGERLRAVHRALAGTSGSFLLELLAWSGKV
jgi:hypothetical protein